MKMFNFLNNFEFQNVFHLSKKFGGYELLKCQQKEIIKINQKMKVEQLL